MVEIKEFKGFLYNIEKIKDISKVIAPPWDLINDEIKEKLVNMSEWNIANLISKNLSPDKVAEKLRLWLKKRIFLQDKEETVYYMKMCFEFEGKKFERKGIFCLLKVEEFENKNIIPHEKIFTKYVDNRYKLLEKCNANFCPVFMVYQDKNFEIESMIEKGKIYFEGKTLNSELFEFGCIEKKDIERIKEIFKEKVVFIADGHHRYNASLMFYKNNPEEKNKYLLVYLTNIESEGLMILPTHRYIPSDVNLKFYKNFIEDFRVKSLEEMEKILSIDEERKIGMFYNGSFYILKLKNYEKLLKENLYSELDSYLLDEFIIKNFVEIKENVEFYYHTSKEYLLNEYKKRKKGVIFFLNSVKKDLFVEMCLKNKLMPQKSTYFYPKVPSGLVIYIFPRAVLQ